MDGGAEGAQEVAMSKVVLDVSLDGFTAGPNVRDDEPMGTAANTYTWMAGTVTHLHHRVQR
jgi:hypothetical protein